MILRQNSVCLGSSLSMRSFAIEESNSPIPALCAALGQHPPKIIELPLVLSVYHIWKYVSWSDQTEQCSCFFTPFAKKLHFELKLPVSIFCLHIFVLFNVNTCMEMKGNKNISVKQILHGRKYSRFKDQIYPHWVAPAGVQSALDTE